MHPVIFGFIKSYGLLLALSFLVGIWLSVRRGRRRGLSPDLVLDLCFAVLISSLIGVRLYFVLTHPGHFHPWYRALYIWDMAWSDDGKLTRGEGSYQARVLRKGDGSPRIYNGAVTIEVIQRNDRPLIVGLYHKADH